MSSPSLSIGEVKQEICDRACLARLCMSLVFLSFVVCKETRETDKATPRENFAMKMEIEILFTLSRATGISRA